MIFMCFEVSFPLGMEYAEIALCSALVGRN